MKRNKLTPATMTVRFFPTLISVLICALPLSAQSDTTPDEKTTAYLKQFRSDYMKSKSDKKPGSIASYYANDIRLMPEFQKTIIGKENVLLYEKAFLNRFELSDYTRTANEIIDLKSRVIEIGSFSEKLTWKENNQSQQVKGKYLDVWIRENNQLTLLTQAWNYDHGLLWEEQLKWNTLPVADVALQAHLPIDNPIRFELAALNRLMEKVISEHDEKIWVQFYADDGSFMYSRMPVVKGKSELGTFFHEHAKGLPVFEKLDVRNDRVDDLGKYVVEYASHIAIIRQGDFSGVFTGKDLAIWRREPNGSLKIYRHIGMYD